MNFFSVHENLKKKKKEIHLTLTQPEIFAIKYTLHEKLNNFAKPENHFLVWNQISSI